MTFSTKYGVIMRIPRSNSFSISYFLKIFYFLERIEGKNVKIKKKTSLVDTWYFYVHEFVRMNGLISLREAEKRLSNRS